MGPVLGGSAGSVAGGEQFVQPEAYDPKLDVFTLLRDHDLATAGFGQAA
ncbi:hypothetical protein [Streptomyces sp. SAJ15]|nr:hypothetical protein [Streptomyces sp. SAJ15]